jgi:hypothetical protein
MINHRRCVRQGFYPRLFSILSRQAARKWTGIGLALIICFFALVLAPNIKADTITLNLGIEYSGGTAPSGIAPWLTATFIDKDPIKVGNSLLNVVQLTMDASGLSGTEFVGEWLFNTTYQSNLSFVYLSNPNVPEVTPGFSPNSFSAGPAKGFDILFDFDEAKDDKFSAGEKVVFDIYGQLDMTLLAKDFSTFNEPGTEPGVFYSAAHVQNTGTDGKGNGWIGTGGNTTPVPEPATMLLLGAGLIGLGFFGRKQSLK